MLQGSLAKKVFCVLQYWKRVKSQQDAGLLPSTKDTCPLKKGESILCTF